MELRRATLGDLDFLVEAELDEEGYPSSEPRPRTDDEIRRTRELMATFATSPTHAALIAVDEMAGPVGSIAYRFFDARIEDLTKNVVFGKLQPGVLPTDAPFCDVFNLWVRPDFRRRGIATSLKLAMEDDARSCGAKMVYTHTEETNPHVVRMNVKLGYREVRRGPLWDDVIRVSLVKAL